MFPLILIIVGLALASVAIFKSGKDVEMSPFIYPRTNDLWYNSKSAYIKDETKISEFMTKFFAVG